MKLSVLMSVYSGDCAEHVEKALESIFYGQTHKPDQIVLVEDGPIGRDVEQVINKFLSELPATVKGTSLKLAFNKGLASALNAGFSEVRGDFVARMDADDISLPERFEVQLKFLAEHTEVGVVGCWIREFCDQQGSRGPDDAVLRVFPESHAKIVSKLPFSTPVPHPGVMMRREIIDAGYRYNEKLRTSQDLELWFRLIKRGFKFANAQQELLLFRFSPAVIKRRDREFANRELAVYYQGIKSLWGISWRLLIPLVRYVFRRTPSYIQTYFYRRVWRGR